MRRACIALLSAALAVIASSAQSPVPARLALIYEGGESVGPAEIRRATRSLQSAATLSVFAPGREGDTLAPAVDLGDFDLVFVDGSLAGGEAIAERIAAARARTRVVVVEPTSSLYGNVSLDDHAWISRYWAQPSQDNYLGLVAYLLARVLSRDGMEPPPPVEDPEQGFYHPDARHLFPTLEAYLAWYRARPGHSYDPSRLSVGLTTHRISYQQRNVAQTDALIREIERRGHNALALASGTAPDLPAHFMRDGAPVIDVLIYTLDRLDRRDREAGLARARTLDVPLLAAFNQNGQTAEQYRAAPNGLFPSLVSNVVEAETDAIVEPMVIAAKGAPRGDSFFTEPLPSQIDWRVTRALAWARLRRGDNAAKRVVLTYYSPGGKANVGGDPDDFLDVPASTVRLLHEMKARGYDVGPDPLPSAEVLARRLAVSASNVGTWAGPELEARVATGDVALLPLPTYRRAFDRLPQQMRERIVEMWGPPPGRVMVYTDATGRQFLVIPRLRFGNIIVAAHPDWGYLQSENALMSVAALPPHHQYLGFFLWMQHEWKADAWVSLFSNIVLQMGKAEAPAADDPVGIMLGGVPHIHPERLGANGGVGNRRKGMAQTVGWYNLVTQADNAELLFELRARLSRYEAQTDDKLRAAAEALIIEEVRRTGLDRALGASALAGPFSGLLQHLRAYLDDLDRTNTPNGTKVLGDAPEGIHLSGMVAAMLGAEFRRALAPHAPDAKGLAMRLIQAVLTDGRAPAEAVESSLGRSDERVEAHLATAVVYAANLRLAPREIGGVLDALSGRWIEPGLGEDPIRRPAALPPGRSLFNFDQATMPTAEAEAVGIAQADALIAQHRDAHQGAYPSTLAFILFSSGIANNHGVTEAQILHLLGTRAVRNERGEVTGVELIPREHLGRPRVDVLVTTAGRYRDHYQDKIELMAEAARLAADSPEPDNPVAAATHEMTQQLMAGGEAPERAAALARARVYSPAPGAYSPSIQFLAKSGDQRGDEARMAHLFTSRMSHAYGGSLYGQAARFTYERNLARTEAATIARSSSVNALLDNPMPAGFLGGLNLAVKAITGSDIDLYVNNLRDIGNPTLEPAAKALQTELRTRYFNRAWLESMKAHGYDGARNMMLMTDHLDLWDSTATKTVSSEDWAEVKAVYVDDTLGLDLDAFFERTNPHAQQVLLANLLGAAARGQWQASEADLAQVAGRLARSAIDHGAACEASICRNQALTDAIERALDVVPGGAALAAGYRTAIDRSTIAIPATMPTGPRVAATSVAGRAPVIDADSSLPSDVSGRVLDDVPAAPPGAVPARTLWLVTAAAVALFVAGWRTARV